MEKNVTNVLKDIGLTEGEIKVYLTLLKKHSLRASIISKETGLNRSNLYKILDKLIQKKLIFSVIKDNVKIFSITRLERLKELYNEKLDKFKENKKQIDNFVKSFGKIPEINLSSIGFTVEVYEGINNVKNVLKKILTLKKGEIVYAIGKEGLMAQYPGIKYWFESFIRQRIKKGIKFYAIYNFHKHAKPTSSKLTFKKYAKLKGMEDMEMSFYRDFLMIYVITKDKPRVILIKNKEIVNGMISYFHFLMEKSKEL